MLLLESNLECIHIGRTHLGTCAGLIDAREARVLELYSTTRSELAGCPTLTPRG